MSATGRSPATWVVEPNVVGGWDVRPDDTPARHSRHSTREDAVAAARELGGDVVVRGLRGQELERFPATGTHAAPPRPAPAPPNRPTPTGARRPGMRLAQLLSLSDQTDETGRLLLEDSAPKAAVKKAERAGVSMATATATFPDTPSRVGGQMNQAAYEALRRDTAAILNGFAWLAAHHRQRAPEETSTPQRLYAVSYLGVTLPHVLFHRADNPVKPHGELPAYVASIFKASRGMFSFSVAMENDRGRSVTMTPAEVVAYAEEKRQLVRPDTGRVCAAPTRLIERTVAVILTGEGGDPSKSELGALIDIDALWEFYKLQDAYGEALSAFRVVLENLTRAGVANDPNRLFRSVIPEGPAKGKTFGQLTEELLRLVNDVQAGMNRVLGRAENATRLGLADIMQML